MRLRRIGLATVVALVGGLAACGVPDSGPPVADSAVRPLGVEGQERSSPPPDPADAERAEDVVKLYFEAASEPEDLERQVRLFISRAGEAKLRPVSPRRIRVVRVTNWGTAEALPPVNKTQRSPVPKHFRLTVTGQVIGVLTDNGVLLPTSRTFSHTFVVHRAEVTNPQDPDFSAKATKSVWLIDAPPSDFVLSTDALLSRYRKVSLYFSNQRSTASLIADRRYVPNAMERKKEVSLLVDWLLQGPSLWLAPVAVRGFPSGTKQSGNAYQEDGRVVVTLSREAEESARPDLMLAQLVWTLSEVGGDRLQLRVGDRLISYRGRTVHTRGAFNGFNAVAAQQDDDRWYYITGRRKVAPQPGVVLPKVLASTASGSDLNTSVLTAALSRTGDLAALVRGKPDNQSLWVGRLPKASGVPNYQKVTGLPRQQIGRPAWMADGGESMLVTARHRLYRIDLDTTEADVIALPSPIGEVSAISMAPDGYRLALVSRGRLYVAPVARRGGVTIKNPRLVTDQIKDAVDVGWVGEQALVVAGRGPGSGGLWQVDIDGLPATPLPANPLAQIPAQVAAYPELGTGQGGPLGVVLVPDSGWVKQVFSSQLDHPDRDETSQGTNPFFAF